MKTRTMLRSAGVCALACGTLGIGASTALAGAAQTGPAAGLPIPFGSPLPASGQGVSVVGDCPSYFYSDDMGLMFDSGNSVIYRITPTGPNGGNAEGQATLWDFTTNSPTEFTGHAHAWFGQNFNHSTLTDGQPSWSAQTISFNGSGPDGSVSISASFGGGTSASGNPSGWFHLKVTCSINTPS